VSRGAGRRRLGEVAYGPGWALVGDAGYHKDPITAQGITDAFRDSELLADALGASFAGTRPLDDARFEAVAEGGWMVTLDHVGFAVA
jgi:flavin-dependent dehydrogenase